MSPLPKEKRPGGETEAPQTKNIATNDKVHDTADTVDGPPIARRTMRLVSVEDIAPEIAP